MIQTEMHSCTNRMQVMTYCPWLETTILLQFQATPVQVHRTRTWSFYRSHGYLRTKPILNSLRKEIAPSYLALYAHKRILTVSTFSCMFITFNWILHKAPIGTFITFLWTQDATLVSLAVLELRCICVNIFSIFLPLVISCGFKSKWYISS